MQRWMMSGPHGARSYAWAQCRYCGRAQSHDCAVVECLLCGSPQCFGNGAGNGLCAICHCGYLPGWSRIGRTVCGYAKCEAPAVAVNRKRPVCLTHASTGKTGTALAEYVASRVAHRDSGKGWEHWKLAD